VGDVAVPGHCGTPLVVSRDGEPVAVGTCAHWAGQPGSLELSWGAARRYQLTAAVIGTGPAGAGLAEGLDLLLALWRDHLAGLPDAGGQDTAAVVDWPSRDVDGIAALLRHGLAPLEVLAVRSSPARSGSSTSTPATANGRVLRLSPRLSIRRAGPADAGTVARLGLEIIRFDSLFGTVNERPDTLDALRREAGSLLAGADPWTWLAERDGEPVGLLAAQRPEAAGWITPMAKSAPAAYLALMFVGPGERGDGVGRALADEFHAAIDAAGVDLALLHHEQLNPLSAPFWHRQGYRPLWTTWQATPAWALRLPRVGQAAG
jgi:GNAT superfamily N-acetyltransferase